MKINVKTKAQKTVQRNLRVSVALNQQMDETSKLADELGADYHATLVSIIEQFDTEFNAKLREMKAKGETYTNSGITAGSESIPEPVSQHSAEHPKSFTKSTISNGAEPERA
jgi:hypothetical protein